MNFNLLDRIGEWNPQLLRELKGQLKPRNIIIAVVVSLVGQFLLFLSFLNQHFNNINVVSKYCNWRYNYEHYIMERDRINQQISVLYSKYLTNRKLIDELYKKVSEISRILEKQCPEDAVNMQLWWQDYALGLFLWISAIAICALLVAGTFMLINDLSQEERRGTLNFIRFTPRSSVSILVGKLLGVPILVYLAVILAIPLHLWLGIKGQIPIVDIFRFYGVLVASCAFFYSFAVLLGLASSGISGLQSWLGSGAVLLFLYLTHFANPINQTPIDWLNLFNPGLILNYLASKVSSEYHYPVYDGEIKKWQWFYLPLGESGAFVILAAMLNYTLWTYWIWQAINRYFHNPNARIITKRQSYWLVLSFELIALGFAIQEPTEYNYWQWKDQTNTNFGWLFLLNLIVLFSLIAMLSNQRQDLQDWARYRHQQVSGKGFWNWSLWQDLLLDEKSPSQLAFLTNMLIITSLWLPWILLIPEEHIATSEEGLKFILAIAFFFSMMMIYASLVQLMLMMRNNKRSLYATATIIAAISLPPTILLVLGINPSDNPIPWLLSTFPWAGIETASLTTTFLAFLAQLSVLVLINVRLSRQLQQVGESATKALLSGRN